MSLPEKEEFDEAARRARERNRPMPVKVELPKDREPHWTDAFRLPDFWTGR